MSYLVFARKFRPQTFEQVVGQKPIVKTLQNSLKRDRVAHAILFSGVRGVGKTTLARLMAKALNCQQGPTAVPCNTCLACTEITAGSALDLLEIDGASNRGIQEVRELKDKLKFMPTSSRFKIVIIDEVHMLTNEAFNALLKTLEEPPAHVYFMFATTELHKIPVTILSRCQRYELQRVNSEDLARHFTNLAASEEIELDKTALSLIVREAEGSVRDGLSLLDQVLSYGQSPITVDDVVEVLGLVKRDIIIGISGALLSGDKQKSLELLAETFKFGMDIKRFIADLLECFRTLMLTKIEGCEKLLDLPNDEITTFRSLADTHSSQTIHLKLKQLMQTAEDLRFSLQPRLTLETAFISIIESGDIVGLTSLLSRLDTAIASLPAQPPEHTTPPDLPSAPPSEDSSESIDNSGNSDTMEKVLESEKPEPLETQRETTATFRLEPIEHEEKAEDDTKKSKREIRKDWLDFISFLKDKKEWMAQSLQQTTSVKEENRELLLEFDDSNDCFMLRKKENRLILTEYILDFFQQDYTVRIISPDNSNGAAAQDANGPKKRRQQLASHHLVRMTEEIFNGQVGDIRISEPNK